METKNTTSPTIQNPITKRFMKNPNYIKGSTATKPPITPEPEPQKPEAAPTPEKKELPPPPKAPSPTPQALVSESKPMDMEALMNQMVVQKPTSPTEGGEGDSEENPDQEQTNSPQDDTPNEPRPATDKERIAAKTIFKTIDFPLRKGAEMIAGEEVTKLNDQDEEELITLWMELVVVNGWGAMPAWLPLVIMMGLTYGNIYKQAFAIKKTKNQSEPTHITAVEINEETGQEQKIEVSSE